MVLLFYTTNISVDLAHHETFHAKDGKGGINHVNFTFLSILLEFKHQLSLDTCTWLILK